MVLQSNRFHWKTILIDMVEAVTNCVVLESFEYEKSEDSTKRVLSEFLRYQDSDAKIKFTCLLLKSSPTSSKNRVGALMEKLTWFYEERWVWASASFWRKSLSTHGLKRFPRAKETRIYFARPGHSRFGRNVHIGSFFNGSPLGVVFPRGILMEEVKPLVTEQSSNEEMNRCQLHFLNLFK